MTTYEKVQARFARFRTSLNGGGADLTVAVTKFVTSLPLSGQRTAKAALRAHFGDAVQWAAVPRAARWSRDESKLRATVLGAPERARLGRSSLSPRDRALLSVLYVVRRVEATTLRWSDVDLEGGLIYVRFGKGGKSAWTAAPPSTIEALRAWYQQSQTPEALVFPNPHGAALHPDRVSVVVRRALRAAGVWRPYRGAHAFRRTFATEFLRRHPDRLRQLQVLMRHSSVATTTLYDFPEPEDYRDAVARIGL